MIIYLIRHGLSSANVSRLVTGTPKDELISLGSQQAELLGNWIREGGISPNIFFVSQWRRAHQTAAALYPNAFWIEDGRLGEADGGSASDLPLDSFLASWPDFYSSPENCYPQGESHLMLNARVIDFWMELISGQASSACLVTHTGPISCILQHVLGIDMNHFPVFMPAHASLTVLESEKNHRSLTNKFRLKGFSLLPRPNIFAA